MYIVLCHIHMLAHYGDDCKSLRIINSTSDQNVFQEYLANHQWSLLSFMDFKVKKGKVIKITKKKQPFTSNFFLGKPVLEEVND